MLRVFSRFDAQRLQKDVINKQNDKFFVLTLNRKVLAPLTGGGFCLGPLTTGRWPLAGASIEKTISRSVSSVPLCEEIIVKIGCINRIFIL